MDNKETNEERIPYLEAKGITVFGPSKAAAQLEGSKSSRGTKSVLTMRLCAN